MSAEVQVEVAQGVRTIAINRPAVKNALTLPAVAELTAAFCAVSRDRNTRAVLLTGRGGAFCSGADLKDALSQPDLVGAPASAVDRFHELMRAVHQCPRPVVALIDGPAVGFGCDLALACDLRVATDRAYFQEKFVRIGLVPDGGGTFWLPRLVGLARAAEMILLGDKLEARQALAYGVVNRVVAPAEAQTVAEELAGRLAKGPPLALRLARRLLYDNLASDLDGALEREKAAQVQCLVSPDLMEGINAFFQKREPNFNDDG